MSKGQHQGTTCGKNAAVQNARVMRFDRNVRGRDFVVGDIHGAFDLVIDAMKQARFDPDKDRLFSCGDLIDRGNASHRCVRFLAQPYVFSVRGNHEDMLIELYENGSPDPAILQVAARYNGFSWWLDMAEYERQEILDAIRKLPLVIEVETERGTVGLIHADVPVGMEWAEFLSRIENGDPETIHTCLWGRDRLRALDTTGVLGVGRLFVGHTPQWGGIRKAANVWAVDTGAVFGQIGIKAEGCLTMAEIITRTEVLVMPRKMPGLVDLRNDDTPTDALFGRYATEVA